MQDVPEMDGSHPEGVTGPAVDPAASSRDRILDAALYLAAQHDWRRVGMTEIAGLAGIRLGELYRTFSSKSGIVAGLMARTDEHVLDGVDEAMEGEPVRDRLFDLIMRRLDELRPHKRAIRSMLSDVPRDPVSVLCVAPHLMQSMAWMLEAAGVRTDGLRGIARVQGLTAIYLRVLRTWLDDDSEDQGKTMAQLDRLLRRTGQFTRR